MNNAGFSTTGPVHESDPAREVAMIRTDVEAVAHLCSTFLPGMVARGRGAVLNVASVAAFQPLPGQAGYAACKAFVLSYSRALAEELRKQGRDRDGPVPWPGRDGVRGGGRLRCGRGGRLAAEVHVGVVRGRGGPGASPGWRRAARW